MNLPYTQPDATKVSEHTDLKKIRVLCVEDDIMISALLKEILSIYIDDLYFASNGAEGIERFRELSPDIIFSDIQMPQMSGIEMARAIKEINPAQQIIFATAYNESSYLLEAIDMGADGYVLKPLNVQKVLAALSKSASKVMTERKVKSQKKFLKAMMDANPTIMMMTTHSRLSYVNNAFLHFFGLDDDAVQISVLQLNNLFIKPCGTEHLFGDNEALFAYFTEADPSSTHSLCYQVQGADYICFGTFQISVYHQESSDDYIFSLVDVTDMDKNYRSMQRDLHTDTLTNIANRLKFNDRLAELLVHRSSPFSVIFFDIDDFKEINDHYGHDTGDIILKELAQAVSKECRKDDLFARWGGEEFVILLNSCTLQEALMVAEKLRQSIIQHHFKPIGHLSCSFGVAQYRSDDDKNTLFKRVDNALYRAKQQGKNRVMTDETDGGERS